MSSPESSPNTAPNPAESLDVKEKSVSYEEYMKIYDVEGLEKLSVEELSAKRAAAASEYQKIYNTIAEASERNYKSQEEAEVAVGYATRRAQDFYDNILAPIYEAHEKARTATEEISTEGLPEWLLPPKDGIETESQKQAREVETAFYRANMLPDGPEREEATRKAEELAKKLNY